jgi:ABC-2 type transport system ATP-binding protein
MSALLKLQNIAKRYGRLTVLRDVSFAVDRGEVVGLIGPNGAGKTTLLRIALGLQRADSGSVTLNGGSIHAALERIRVGYFAGEFTVPAAVRTQAWRSLFHETDRGSEDRPVRQLSRGTRQLLGLRTLFALPALRLVVLDEPWEGLDPDAARWLSASLQARRGTGAAALVSSHRLHDLAGVCDRFVFLDGGTAAIRSAREIDRDGHLSGNTLLETFDRLRERSG